MQELTTELMDEKLQSGEPFVVDYYADWCEACIEMLPLVSEIAEENPTINFYKVNVDDNPELKERARIKAIPMIMMYKEGRAKEFLYGINEKEKIEKKLRRIGG